MPNRIYLLISVIFAFWSFAALIRNFTSIPEAVFAWRLMSAISWSIGTSAILHFSLSITKEAAYQFLRFKTFLIYLPGILLLSGYFITGFVFNSTENRVIDFLLGVVVNNVYYIIYIIASCIILHKWSQKNDARRKKKQSQLIILTLIISIVLIFLYGSILPMLVDFILPFIMPIFLAIWAYGMWRAITKYRFLKFQRELASKEIMNNILDMVILIDPEGKITDINQRTEQLLKIEKESLIGKGFSLSPLQMNLVNDSGEEGKLEELLKGKIKEYKGQAVFEASPELQIPVRYKMTAVIGDLNEILGVVIAAQDLTTEAALAVEVDNRKKAETEAKQANKSKSEFLANMSHEIRTPLNGVIGFSELLQKTELSSNQEQYIQNIISSAQSLLGIINDILDFSKIEAGKLELDIVESNIVEIVASTADILRLPASKKGVELLLDIQPDIPSIALVDPVRLKQVLINLVGNAVKFTPEGEVEIKLAFKKFNDKLGIYDFSVRDTGIGIKEEQRYKLFQAFSQADTSTTRQYGGTGLGLVISNMLINKMGGSIQLSSKYGRGSEFSFSIETQYKNDKKELDNRLDAIKTVLIVDDNDINRKILEKNLEYWKLEYTSIKSGLEAIQHLKNHNPYDVILMDYDMPDLNGLETIRLIRKKMTPNQQPIILLHSSTNDFEIQEKCNQYGVIYHLIKPVKSSELLSYLQQLHHQEPFERTLKKTTAMKLPEISPKILIAEDMTTNRLLIKTILKKMIPNSSILEATNGQEAFDITTNQNIDLILMDIQMPQLNGIDATRQIRRYEKEHKLPRKPIIALTAGVVKGEDEKCHKAGMDAFIKKPIDQCALFKTLKEALKT